MIGILAGMGPKSTGPFIDQVVSSFQSMTGAKYDIDFPPMMIYSLPTPFYVDKPVDHKAMEIVICDGLKKLESCGVAFIAMPCVTAHAYFTILEQSIQIPLLNIVSISLERIPTGAKRVALLATRLSVDAGFFQKRLKDAKFEYVMQPNWQQMVDAMILSIKTDVDNQNAFGIWEKLSSNFLQAGVDTILLACTDLNVLFKDHKTPFQIVDASLCLAQSIVSRWVVYKNL